MSLQVSPILPKAGPRTPIGRLTWRRLGLAGSIVLWIGIVAAGTNVLMRYEASPGEPGRPSAQWPASSRLSPQAGKFTLVMLAHPDCSCSRAGLSELQIAMARLQGRLNVFVIFSKPGSDARELRASALWQIAAAIPGVTVHADPNADEVRKFVGYVSGQTMLYSPQGRLLFSGGITGSRGHEGDNVGLDSIVRLARGQQQGPVTTPVFGCALFSPSNAELREDAKWTKE